PFFNSRPNQLAAVASSQSVPVIYPYRELVAACGLMRYGSSVTDAYRQVGIYTERILKGEQPANQPVQQPTQAKLIIHRKTAKTLALTVPLPLPGRGGEVIECGGESLSRSMAVPLSCHSRRACSSRCMLFR